MENTTPFEQQLAEAKTTNVQGKDINRGIVNLTMTIHAMRLYTKDIIPYRGFRLKDVKEFYGIKGNKHKMLEQLNQMYLELTGTEYGK